MSAPDFSGYKEGQMNAWKHVLDKLDQLTATVEHLEERVTQLEGEKAQ